MHSSDRDAAVIVCCIAAMDREKTTLSQGFLSSSPE
jgi:hypothetical protein